MTRTPYAFLGYMIAALGVAMWWDARHGLDGFGGLFSPSTYRGMSIVGVALCVVGVTTALLCHLADLTDLRRRRRKTIDDRRKTT